ncbi:MAG: tetratricopeptide repeat protein [Treponema sp.]|jgi:tetratricopeptide (TPR) repeat protein|nr:tetratricopeptide repeat protein [Treponema sp.]
MARDEEGAREHLKQGNYYFHQGDYDRAIESYTEAIKLNPQYAKAYSRCGFAYAHKGDLDRAIADCNHAIRLDPNDGHAYNERGIVYRNKDDYDRAIEDYTKAIRLAPNNAMLYNNRGEAFDAKGDYDRAIADYNEAIRLAPNDVSAYYRRSGAYAGKGNLDRAGRDYETAWRIDSKHPLARQYVDILVDRIKSLKPIVFPSKPIPGKASMPVSDEIAAIEAVIDDLEKKIGDGRIGVASLVNHLRKFMQSLTVAELIANMAGIEAETMEFIEIGKIGSTRIRELREEYPNDSRISELAHRAADCYFTLRTISFTAGEEMAIPDEKEQAHYESQVILDAFKKSLPARFGL